MNNNTCTTTKIRKRRNKRKKNTSKTTGSTYTQNKGKKDYMKAYANMISILTENKNIYFTQTKTRGTGFVPLPIMELFKKKVSNQSLIEIGGESKEECVDNFINQISQPQYGYNKYKFNEGLNFTSYSGETINFKKLSSYEELLKFSNQKLSIN